VSGQIIKTTMEHPFWVVDAGWRDAHELKVGDRFLSHDGQELTLHAIRDTCEYATVYNLRIAEYHTYFVGCAEWGFSVWAHNTCYDDWVKGNKDRINAARQDGETFNKAAPRMWAEHNAAQAAANQAAANQTASARMGSLSNNGFGQPYGTRPVQSSTAKPSLTGAYPNSIHVRLTADGRAVQSTIYDQNGAAIGHIDWKDREGHIFSPGRPWTGHGPGSAHIPLTDLRIPPDWQTLPIGVTPVLRRGF